MLHMNDTPTPETDAEAWRDESHIMVVEARFAERLERERNELRLRIENLEAATIHSCHDQCQRPACKARRERDEAREDARRLYDCLISGHQLLGCEEEALRKHEELVAREG